MSLRHVWVRGYRSAFKKFALSTPTQVDAFMADVESGKDVPPEAVLGEPGPPSGLDQLAQMQQQPHAAQQQPQPQEPDSLGSTVGFPPPEKQGAMGPKEMAWFRDTLGEQGGTDFLNKHMTRFHTGVQQNFAPGAPVATAAPAPQPAPGGPPKVIVDPSLGARAAQAAKPAAVPPAMPPRLPLKR